jgi:hypothetical protein
MEDFLHSQPDKAPSRRDIEDVKNITIKQHQRSNTITTLFRFTL